MKSPFKVGDILYDASLNVVAKLIEEWGTAIPIDELHWAEDDLLKIELDFTYCTIATPEQIERAFNRGDLQMNLTPYLWYEEGIGMVREYREDKKNK